MNIFLFKGDNGDEHDDDRETLSENLEELNTGILLNKEYIIDTSDGMVMIAYPN